MLLLPPSLTHANPGGHPFCLSGSRCWGAQAWARTAARSPGAGSEKSPRKVRPKPWVRILGASRRPDIQHLPGDTVQAVSVLGPICTWSCSPEGEMDNRLLRQAQFNVLRAKLHLFQAQRQGLALLRVCRGQGGFLEKACQRWGVSWSLERSQGSEV